VTLKIVHAQSAYRPSRRKRLRVWLKWTLCRLPTLRVDARASSAGKQPGLLRSEGTFGFEGNGRLNQPGPV
jgi:hypothetical protein